MDGIEKNVDESCVKKVPIVANRCRCSRCGFEWWVYTDVLPKTCSNPKCRSPYWRKLRVKGLKKEVNSKKN